jgi:YbgC/YbaW family acyl-CoA thioester hydrolase
MDNLPQRRDFRLLHRLRVRWSEVDQQRIVFNAHYLTYIDTAFGEYWRAMGVAYEDIPALLEGDLYVKKASIEYHGSARMDELIDVGLRCERIGNSSIRMGGAIFRGETLLITAELVYVFADPATQTSRPVPPLLRVLFDGFESGAEVVQVRAGPWTDLGTDARALRHAVYVEELGLPAMLAEDPSDLQARHVVLRNRLGQVLATGRMAEDGAGRARVGRLAVRHNLRTNGLGARAVEVLVDEARCRGMTEVVLGARQSAQSFYQRLGFVPVGDVFMEAGEAHVEMVRRL